MSDATPSEPDASAPPAAPAAAAAAASGAPAAAAAGGAAPPAAREAAAADGPAGAPPVGGAPPPGAGAAGDSAPAEAVPEGYHYYKDDEGNDGYYDDDGNYYPCGDTTGYYDAQGTYHLYEAGAAATAAAEAAAGAASVDTSVASGSADAAPVVAADSAGPQAAPAPGPAPVDDGEVAAVPEAAPLLAEAAPPAEVDASGPPAPGAVTVAAAPPAMAPAPPSETSPPAPPAEPSMATGPSASSSSPYMQLVALGRLQHGCLPSVLARLAMHGAHGMAAPMHPELLDGYGTPAFAATPEAALASAPALRLELVEANGVPVPLGDASDRVAFKHRARAMLFDGTNFVGNTAELSAAMLGGADANGAAWAFGAGALQASQKRRGAPPPAPLLVRSRLAAEGAALLIELTVCYACTESEARAARGAFKHGMLVEEEVCAAFVLLPLRGLFDAHSGGLAGGARTLRLPLYTGPFDAPVQVPPTVGNAASRTGWLRRVGANSVAAELVVALRPLARRSPEELPLLPLLPSQLLLPLDERHRSLCRAIGSYRASVAAVLACDADTGGDAAGKALRRAPAGPGACLPDILDHPVLRDIFVDAWHAECTAIRRKGRAMLDEKSVMSEALSQQCAQLYPLLGLADLRPHAALAGDAAASAARTAALHACAGRAPQEVAADGELRHAPFDARELVVAL